MPFVSRRRLAELQARADRLRGRAEQAEADLLKQGHAAGRLARRTDAAEAATRNVASAFRAGHRDLVAENQQLRELVDRIRRDRDGLRVQLNRAMGYDDAAMSAIAAGTGEPRTTAKAGA